MAILKSGGLRQRMIGRARQLLSGANRDTSSGSGGSGGSGNKKKNDSSKNNSGRSRGIGAG